jgi:RNA polymerase sigma-70 factor (ECF subfamily)
MPDGSTTQIQLWVERLNTGDASAREQLIRHACERLRLLTRKLLRRDFARVREVEETDDVLQNALLRLHRALQDPAARPTSAAHFFRLATLQIRRELIDLSRHHFGPARPRLVPQEPNADSSGAGRREPGDDTHDPDRLINWREFHDRVEALPPEERDVFDLLWYQELSQAEAANVLNVSVPTVKRRWLSARLLLQEALPGGGPES